MKIEISELKILLCEIHFLHVIYLHKNIPSKMMLDLALTLLTTVK